MLAGVPAIDFPPEGVSDGVVAVRPYRSEDAAPLLAGVQDELVVRFAHVVWADAFDWRAPRAEIGFWLLPEARGRGVATRAVCVFCRWAFAELALARIQASADVDNPASQRVL